jgi:hypothetical protein
MPHASSMLTSFPQNCGKDFSCKKIVPQNCEKKISPSNISSPNFLPEKLREGILWRKTNIPFKNFSPKIPFCNFAGRDFLAKKKYPLQKFLPQNSFPQNCGKDFSCEKNNVSFKNFFPKIASRNFAGTILIP